MKRVILLVLALTLLPVRTASAGLILFEGFDNISTLGGSGWSARNNSNPVGLTEWFQGNPDIFAAHSGAPNSYIAANFNAAAFGGDISLWGMTPELEFVTGQSVASFWTRVADPGFNDGLEFRLSTSGVSTDVGSTTTSVGVFTAGVTIPLEDQWVLHQIYITNAGPAFSGRLAFRYVVTDTSVNGDYIGIDSFSFENDSQPVPEPASTLLLFGVGIAGLVGYHRRRR